MTKQAIDLQANDIIEVNGELELVHSVFFNQECCDITVHRVHQLHTFCVDNFQEIVVIGEWK